MHGRSTPAIRALSTALLALTLTGTAVGAQAPKEGNGPEPVMLDLVVGSASGGWFIDMFSERVAELSDGQLAIHVAGTIDEHSVAEQVLSGEADLGQVFARGLDGIGAKGFQALLAPFVANDAEVQRAVATGPIGADILAELRDHGLEGLAIVPGDRRFVVGLGKSFVTLDDFAGATINVPETAANFALLRALGAEPSGVGWNTLEEAAAADLDGVVTSMSSTGYPGMVVTGNLAVQAVPSVWFANADTMAELSPEHREILRAAAQAVQAAVLEGLKTTESTVVPCAAGARIVAAADDDVAAIVAAAQPVIDEMASDPVTASFLERIAALKAETTPAPFPASCGGGTPSDTSTSRIPDGTYAATVTYEDALRLGTDPDECVTPDRNMVYTLVIAGVNWTALGTCGDGPTWEGAHGTFEYDGASLVMRESGPGRATFAWSADDAGFTLTLLGTEPELAPPAVLRFIFEHEFRRVSAAAPTSTIPDGTYAATVTHKDALRVGTNPNDCVTPDRSLVDTLVIEGANFTEIQTCGDSPPEIASEGTLEYDGDTLVMRSPGLPGGATFTWSADDTHLTLKLLGTVDEAAWPPSIMRILFEHEFTRISPDAPTSTIPDGTYTATVTYEDALRINVDDECTSPTQSAVVTLVIEDGANWTQLGACGDGPAEVGAQGTLEYDGDTLVMREPGISGSVTFAWSAGDSGLTLKLLGTDPEDAPREVLLFLFEHEFTKASS